jgi:hypothetical protein
LSNRYRKFANHEAHGISDLYEDIALCVSDHDAVLEYLESFPAEKQQPNLLFASYRHHCGIANSGEHFCTQLLKHQDVIRSTMLARSTQTNEPARCATLMPVLAALPQPLSLLEVGASAGLCLYPDRYAYQYGNYTVKPEDFSRLTPMFHCAANGSTPLPRSLPKVIWRAGIDLNPLSPKHTEDTDWLQSLVWPEQTERLQNLKLAIDVARREESLRIAIGDALDRLAEVVRDAPTQSTVVVYHSAVLAYVQSEKRRNEFSELVTSLGVTWISNEHPLVFPSIAARLSFEVPKNRFLLSVDGEPVASTGPHGQSIDWF